MSNAPAAPAEKRGNTPCRQLGRVDDQTWQMLREAAARDGMTFSGWALELLIAAADRPDEDE